METEYVLKENETLNVKNQGVMRRSYKVWVKNDKLFGSDWVPIEDKEKYLPFDEEEKENEENQDYLEAGSDAALAFLANPGSLPTHFKK